MSRIGASLVFGMVIVLLAATSLLNAAIESSGSFLPIVLGDKQGPTPLSTPSPAITSSPTTTTTATLPTSTSAASSTPSPTASSTPTPSPTPTEEPCGTLGGIISTDTELSSGCYYYVAEKLLVEENVTLSIPKDVVLIFTNEVYMRVDGALIVNGTKNQPVRFTHDPPWAWWEGIQISSKSGSSSSLRNLIIEYAATENGALGVEDAQPVLDGITLQYNASKSLDLSPPRGQSITFSNGKIVKNYGMAHIDGGAVFENNYIAENLLRNVAPAAVKFVGDNIVVRNNIFVNNENRPIDVAGGSETAPILISGNSFEGNAKHIFVHGGFETASIVISENLFRGNTGGAIESVCYGDDTCNAVIQSNDFENNSVTFGRIQSVLLVSCGNILNHNNIHNINADYAVAVMTPSGCDIDSKNNWWGTDQEAEIDSLIFDYYDDFELGKIIYEPIAAEPFSTP